MVLAAGKIMEQLQFLCIAGGIEKWYNHSGKQFCSVFES